MITFKTESGGVYEVLRDEGTLFVRKTSGDKTTARATPEWRECMNVDLPVVGHSWFINWGTENPDGTTQATVTSRVVEIGRQDA